MREGDFYNVSDWIRKLKTKFLKIEEEVNEMGSKGRKNVKKPKQQKEKKEKGK